MKQILTLLILVFLSVAVVACNGLTDAQKESESSIESSSTLSQVALEVPTIWCSGCQPRVEASARSVAGVGEVRFDDRTVIISYDPVQTTPDDIIAAIERGGDEVTKVTGL